jgi:hypothetical protein
MALKHLVRSVQGAQDVFAPALDPLEIGFLLAEIKLQGIGLLPQSIGRCRRHFVRPRLSGRRKRCCGYP